MYIVTIENDKKIYEIHGEKQKLKSGNIVKGINTIDSFSFTLLPSNAGFNRIYDYKTLVKVYNTKKKRYEFFGRVLYSNTEMDSNGLISKEVTCESYFGFFCDSKQNYVATKNWTVEGLLTHLVDTHNSQVEDYKKFSVGTVTVTDLNDNLYLGIQRDNTWKTIEEKLIKKLGGEIRFRVIDGVTYIDYMPDIGVIKTTAIQLSKNMKSISRECDPSTFISRLIPLGAKLSEDSEERLDITSVNNGLNYIEDADAKALYGIRVEHVEFDNVNVASTLMKKGLDYLAENNRVQVKYSIKALDLSLLGLDYDDFDIANRHPIINPLLSIDDTARINKKNINVCNDVESTIEVGDNFKSFSDIQLEQKEQLREELNNRIETTKNEIEDKMETNNDSLRQEIEIAQSSMSNTAHEIVSQVLEEYVRTDDFETYKKETSTEITQTANDVTVKAGRLESEISKVNGDLQDKFNLILKYFTFDVNGLTIGQVDNPYKVVINNERYSMFVNGVEMLWFDGDGKGHIPELKVTASLDLFGYHIYQDDSGNVNCQYVED